MARARPSRRMQDGDDIERRRAWQDDGFFVVRDHVRAGRIAELVQACDHVLSQVRAGSSMQGHSSTLVSGLLAPEYFVHRPETFTHLRDYMSSPEVLLLIHGLDRVGEGLPNLRDTQYFHEPSARDHDGMWHRDGDRPGPGALDSARPTLVRYRVALAHDDHLEYVPGSHARSDTPEERSVLKGAVRNGPLSSRAIRIELEPGDVCVFDTWGIHRARYRRDRVRRTLDLLFGFGSRTPRAWTTPG
jgi:ectoine hydroxylase-related dioxygenase (phytanoyl-CoA dioxygenase family)